MATVEKTIYLAVPIQIGIITSVAKPLAAVPVCSQKYELFTEFRMNTFVNLMRFLKNLQNL